MQPSGLVFLVIIAIWATYLLQHWVRRREHLATARSIDRFSDAMRVLERRIPQPAFDMAALQDRSYAVSPARPSRPSCPADSAPRGVGARRAEAPTANAAMRHAAAVGATRGSHTSARFSARRLRGLSLLVTLSLALIFSTLAVLSVLPWWSPVLVVAAVMTDLLWLRHAAVSKRATRRANASADRAMAAVRRTATPARSTARSTARSGSQPAAGSSIRSEPRTAAPVAGAAKGAASTVQPAAPDRSSWEPVPVPPPTYTLKAKAERPDPAPAAVTEPPRAQASSFDGLVDDDELDGVLDRRAAGA